MQVGIVEGAIDDPQTLEATVSGAPIDPLTDRLRSFAHRDLAAVVVRGEAGVQAALHAGVSAPLLPVDAPRGLEPIASADVGDALHAIAEGSAACVDRPVIRLSFPDGRSLDGLFEATAMTTGPAEISEFEIATPDRTVAALRADGILVGTPAGSVGYAADAGGPVLGPSVSGLAVVPVSPFLTQEHTWVLEDDPVSITVARDESIVGTFVDGRAAGRLRSTDTVSVSQAGSIETLRVPQSLSPYLRE